MQLANGMITWYGIKDLTYFDEWNLPENAKQTRNNKMKIIDTCYHARQQLEAIENRARGAPELDDTEHSALVQELADKVKEIYKLIQDADMIGR